MNSDALEMSRIPDQFVDLGWPKFLMDSDIRTFRTC
jgi:hypothetical protein